MSETSELRTADLHGLLGVIDDAMHDDPGPAVPWALLDGLLGLFAGDVEVSFNESVAVERRFVITQGSDAEQHGVVDDFVEADSPWWTDSPCELEPPGSPHLAIRWSQDPDRHAAVHRTASYEAFWQGVTDMLSVRLPAPAGTRRSLTLFRESGTFSDRDQALLTLLRPHIAEIHRLGVTRRAATPRLTDREWQVLELAAQGRSNQQIARTVFISVSTVRKHLEHIYDKTGARSRSAAVSLMMPLRA